MGGGVVASLRRAGFATHVRDIRPEATAAAVALGAQPHDSAAALAAACDIVIVVVVDSDQVDAVLFGADGVTAMLAPGAIVMLASTLDPDDVAGFAARLSVAGYACARRKALPDEPLCQGESSVNRP